MPDLLITFQMLIDSVITSSGNYLLIRFWRCDFIRVENILEKN
jgi:hypothetical protein